MWVGVICVYVGGGVGGCGVGVWCGVVWGGCVVWCGVGVCGVWGRMWEWGSVGGGVGLVGVCGVGRRAVWEDAGVWVGHRGV